jgi:hypothetical protein
MGQTTARKRQEYPPLPDATTDIP